MPSAAGQGEGCRTGRRPADRLLRTRLRWRLSARFTFASAAPPLPRICDKFIIDNPTPVSPTSPKRLDQAPAGHGSGSQIKIGTERQHDRGPRSPTSPNRLEHGLDQQYDLCLEVVEGYEEVREKVAPQAANLVYMESACKAHHRCKPNLCS